MTPARKYANSLKALALVAPMLCSVPSFAGLIEVEQMGSFEILSGVRQLTSRAANGQNFNFVASAGPISDSVSFLGADAGVGTLVGVELELLSVITPTFTAMAQNGNDPLLITAFLAELDADFAVASSLGGFLFEDLVDLDLNCTLDTPLESCSTPVAALQNFNTTGAAGVATFGDFLGANMFDVDLLATGPVLNGVTLSTMITGSGTSTSGVQGTGTAQGGVDWIGDLKLTYIYEVDMQPSPVPAPTTLLLILCGAFGLRRKFSVA